MDDAIQIGHDQVQFDNNDQCMMQPLAIDFYMIKQSAALKKNKTMQAIKQKSDLKIQTWVLKKKIGSKIELSSTIGLKKKIKSDQTGRVRQVSNNPNRKRKIFSKTKKKTLQFSQKGNYTILATYGFQSETSNS